jgi:1,4-alpha-glucan branching enzyme
MKRKSTGDTKKIRFEMTAEPGSQVFVAGSFNNWSPTTHRLTNKPDSIRDYETALPVPKGMHGYKFIVNGVWTMDPNCLHRMPNGLGTLNSVIYV